MILYFLPLQRYYFIVPANRIYMPETYPTLDLARSALRLRVLLPRMVDEAVPRFPMDLILMPKQSRDRNKRFPFGVPNLYLEYKGL